MKALIIGGGFAGTTTGNLLAQDGWEVTILEKAENLGVGVEPSFMEAIHLHMAQEFITVTAIRFLIT